jgi:hypothetical protein
MRIKYHTIEGVEVKTFGLHSFYRLRYLTTAEQDPTKPKQLKYVQPPNTQPHAYFPLNLTGTSWSSLAKNATEPVIVTEGELKAAKACKEGFPTIGLGGVWSWRSSGVGVSFLPELEEFNWVKRNVYVVFDSDYKTNQNVLNALVAFSEQLVERGAFVHVISLPAEEVAGKVGLDDFLVLFGKGKFTELLRNAENIGLSRPLHQLNNKYVYIRNPGFIVNKKDLTKVDPKTFTGHLESTLKHQVRSVKPTGEIKYSTASAAKSWLTWSLRSECSKLTYEPGKPQILENFDPDEPPLFNTWRGWGVEPKEGDVAPFLELLEHLFFAAEPGAKEWFLQWCAYPLQNPGVKLATAAVLYGVNQGTGKSTIGYTLGKIYGDNFTEIQQSHLFGKFNEWCEAKQLIMCDDITGSEKKGVGDFLKALITQEEVRINLKFINGFSIPSKVNFLFTSNHPDAFYLDRQDRRFFILEVVSPPKDPVWYSDYAKWLKNGGSSALFHYLLNLDTSTFNPQAPAFRTSAKLRMIEQNQSDLASWLGAIWDFDGYLPDFLGSLGFPLEVRERQLFSSAELLKMYDRLEVKKVTAKRVGLELQKLNSRALLSNAAIATAPYKNSRHVVQSRYYCINKLFMTKWCDATRADIKAHVEKFNWIDPPHVSKF